MAETILKDIEWKPSRRGLVAPMGVLKPITIDGKSVERVTLFNKEYIKNMELGIGDKLSVKLLGGRLPGIEDNLTRSGTYEIPNKCPVCNTLLREVGKDLYCVGKFCKGTKAMYITHYCDVMKIYGISYHYVMRFMNNSHYFRSIEDLYKMKDHKIQFRNIVGRERMDYILENIEKSRFNCTLEQLIYGLSLVGLPTAKAISNYCKNDLETFMSLASRNFDWTEIGVFQYKSEEVNDEFYKKYKTIDYLSRVLYIEPYISPEEYNDIFVGMNFVVSGTPTIYKNRDEIVDIIHLYGGRVMGELNEKTTYLIDCGSIFFRSDEAKSLGIKVISEQEFYEMVGEEI